MKAILKTAGCIATFLTATVTATAQHIGTPETKDYFKVGGQYRLRTEYRHGYRTLSYDSLAGEAFVGQRTRLTLDYKKNKINVFASLQDSRTWGDEEMKKDIGGLQFNEAWMELSLPVRMTLKMGRQELAYDDHRILGNLDWANLTISHDAAILKYISPKEDLKIHLGGAYNHVGEPNVGTRYTLKNYKHLVFLWAKKDLKEQHSAISVLAVLNGMTPTDTLVKAAYSTYTAGPSFNYSNKGWSVALAGYFQGGETENNLSEEAYMLNSSIGYKKNKLFFGAGYDVLSGNSDNTAAGHTNNFNTLYATNHKFYGYMDYFLSIPTDTKQRGLTDGWVRAGITPGKNYTFTLDVHSFALANANNVAAKKIGKDLGREMDLLFDYKPSPVVAIQAGYCMMFATTNMELIKGGDAANYNAWAYVMVKVSPTFFMHEFTN